MSTKHKPTTGKAKRNDKITRDMRKACAIIDLPLDQFNTHSFTYNAMTWLAKIGLSIELEEQVSVWVIKVNGVFRTITQKGKSIHDVLSAAVLATKGGE
jgi:hypothetical protein